MQCTNTIGQYTKTQYWCNLRVAQSKGLHFYQTRSNAIILHNTLPAMCIEKVVIRKSGEEVYSKTYQSPTVPQRVVLKPNLHYGRQDTISSDARTSFDHSSKHKETCGGGTYNENCRDEIGFRINGLPHSTVQEHDHIRKEPFREPPEQRSITSRPLKFEDRSQEETERQERCARGDAWRLANNILKLKETDKATLFSRSNEWCLPAPSVIKPEEGEFVVDSEASHFEQERPELCRIGNRKGLQKSDDGCCSQRRSANRRRSDRVCQRI